MSAASFEVMAEGLHLAEGPLALSDGSVLVVEVAASRITRCWGAGRTEVIATPGGGPNGLAIGADGGLYVCNSGGVDHDKMCHASGPGHEARIERVDMATGKVERIHERCGDEPLSAPNDIVIDAEGMIWFSDIGKVTEHSHGFGGVYRAAPDGSSIERVHRGLAGYNGIGLSPDGRTVYVSETFSGRLIALDAQEPNRGPARLVGTVGLPDYICLDSLAVTAAGNICVACPPTGDIASFSPNGDLRFIDLPPNYTTNIAFGGADMKTAFITQAGSGTLLKMPWHEAGLKLHFNA